MAMINHDSVFPPLTPGYFLGVRQQVMQARAIVLDTQKTGRRLVRRSRFMQCWCAFFIVVNMYSIVTPPLIPVVSGIVYLCSVAITGMFVVFIHGERQAHEGLAMSAEHLDGLDAEETKIVRYLWIKGYLP